MHVRCGRRDEEVAYFGATVTPASLPFSQSQVIRIFDSVTLLNLLQLPLQCWPFSSSWGARKETADSMIVNPSREGSDEGLERLNYKSNKSAVRFCLGAFSGVRGPSMETTQRISSTVERAFRQVSLDRQSSLQIRERSAETIDGAQSYKNITITVQKTQQGSATLVIFEPAEPVFLIRNETKKVFTVKQRGVWGDSEQLLPDAELPFLWYDPKGELELDLKVNFSASARATEEGSRKEEKDYSIACDFQADTGQEVRRIMEPTQYRKWESARMPNRRATSSVKKRQTVNSLGSQNTGDEDINTFAFKLDGIGLALSDAFPMQFLYLAADKLLVEVTHSEIAVLEGHEHEPSVVPFDIMSSITELKAGPSTISGSDAASSGSPSGAVPMANKPLEIPNAFGLGSAMTSASLSTNTKISDGIPSSEPRGVPLLQRFLQCLPPLDVRATLLNIQADSHVPGSFFPCVIRPFECRSQLWRSLCCYTSTTQQAVRRQLRRPVLTVNVDSFRMMGQSVVMKSCVAKLDKLVVNVDEAILVALSAYYCRIAVYFSLPPFDQQDSVSAGARRSLFMDVSEGECDETLNGRQQQVRIGQAERQAGIEAHKFSRRRWLVRVEDELDVSETTAYLSMRLLESTNPYVDNLQRDAHTGVLLGMLTPFYSAAVFQPAMLAASSRRLFERRICMSPTVLAKIFEEHFVDPIITQFCWLLVVSFDFIGNPLHFINGVVAGIRELVRQPYKRGIIGIPLGFLFFLCSVFGSIFDLLARISNSLCKGLERMQRLLYKRLGVKTVGKYSALFALSKAPTSFVEGLSRGCVLALLQCEVVLLNVIALFRWFVLRTRRRCCCILPLIIQLLLTLVVTLLLGVLSVALLFFHYSLQGLVMSLYRCSAEAVSDLDPLQLFALELPTHVRPLRTLQSDDSARAPQHGTSSAKLSSASAEAPPGIRVSMGVVTGGNAGSRQGAALAPFAFLPSLAQAHLEHQDGYPTWLRRRDPLGEDAVISATWCGSTSMAEGVASILAETTQHIALLHVSGWGSVTQAGRPSRPKPLYRWAWRVRRAEVTALILSPAPNKKDWLLKLEVGPAPSRALLEVGFERSRVVPFSSKNQAHRALESLAPSIRARGSVSCAG